MKWDIPTRLSKRTKYDWLYVVQSTFKSSVDQRKAALKIQAEVKLLGSHILQYRKMIGTDSFNRTFVKFRQALTLKLDEKVSLINRAEIIETIEFNSNSLRGQVAECFFTETPR